MLELMFAGAVGTLGWTWLGYPVLTRAVAMRQAVAVKDEPKEWPSMTVLVAAYQEEDWVRAKLADIRAQDYPEHKLTICFVLDGSTDRSFELLDGETDILLLHRPQRAGKAAAVRRAMKHLNTELVVMTDANARFAPGSLKALARPFVQQRCVGLVSGAKRVLQPDGSDAGGEGLYWRYENQLKTDESRIHSAIGAVGEILCVRRQLWRSPPKDSVVEDFHLTLDILDRGFRHVFAPDAISWEGPSATSADDLERRTRIAAGGWQTLWRMRHLLDPRRDGWLALSLGSHRALRWLLAPWLLVVVLPMLSLALLATGTTAPYQLAIAGIGLFWLHYGFFEISGREPRGPLRAVHFLALANLAAVLGAVRFARGSQQVTWERVSRAGDAR